jgi:pyruvate/2-oxoglutarate dehydrogenase complex dihydrolipoamide acyltransferase (E2) component
MRGRTIRLSVPRRIVIDLLYFASGIPTVPVQKRMSLGALVAARAACRERPRWTTIFTKAYALMAREFPEFRRAYVKIPWPHLYEYPASNATVIIERDYRGEAGLFSISIKEPARQSLRDIGRQIEHASTAPVEEIKDFRRTIQFARLPRPLRRVLWWICLNIGRQRGNYFGTFGVSVYSALSAESLHPLSPLTTLLNYGVINSDGVVDVRIIYDHRVMNGATVARALARLEEILSSVMLEEVRALAETPTKAESL